MNYYAGSVMSTGFAPSLSIFSSDDSPSTLLLSHAVCWASISVSKIAWASSLVFGIPNTFAIQRFAFLLLIGSCQISAGYPESLKLPD